MKFLARVLYGICFVLFMNLGFHLSRFLMKDILVPVLFEWMAPYTLADKVLAVFCIILGLLGFALCVIWGTREWTYVGPGVSWKKLIRLFASVFLAGFTFNILLWGINRAWLIW